MGTRADFYVGRGKDAEWIGSVALDGYPDGIPSAIKESTREGEFRAAVSRMLGSCNYATHPEQGWPWPREDSHATDYAYAFDGHCVWASRFGHTWFDPNGDEPENSCDGEKVATFPNMKDLQNVTMGPRSGLLVLRG